MAAVISLLLLHDLYIVLFLLIVSTCPSTMSIKIATYLPLLHLILLALILNNKLIKHLLQSLRIRLQSRNNLLHRPLHKNPIDHAKAFSIFGKRLQCLQDESMREAGLA